MADTLEKKISVGKVIAKKARGGQSPAAALDRAVADIDPPVAKLATPVTDPSDERPAPESVDTEADDLAKLYDVDHPTGDRMRDKVRALLCDAMFQKGEDWVKDRSEAEAVANAIENQMFLKFNGNGAPYKAKYRNISFNLKDKKNGKLRMAVLHRLIPPSELLSMSNEDLANDELKKTREEVHEKMTRDAMPYSQPAASTDMFKCGKCKERKCTYFQMQTRSADEPLTTFVFCVNCGNRWRF